MTIREDISKRTKRLELLLRSVLALPNASSNGLDCKMMSFTRCNRTHRTFQSSDQIIWSAFRNYDIFS